MKVSIFGSGSIGLRHLNNLVKLKKELKISSIFSFDNKNKKKFLGKSKKFTFTQNLEIAAKNCDVAFICVPTHLHNQTIKKILKYTKCHFYIEKPLSNEIKDCLKTLNDIKKIDSLIVNFSKKTKDSENEIRNFLRMKMYNNKNVLRKNNKGKLIIKKLFNKIKKNPQKYISKENLNSNGFRAVSDFISGMTDRYAIKLYKNIK